MNCKDCIKDDKCKLFSIDRRGSHKNCFVQKPKTNADRIRAMSDEELAVYLCNNRGFFDVKSEVLYWLKQEVE